MFSEIAFKKFSKNLAHIFVKSSTGYYPSDEKGYSGATPKDIQLMLKYAYPLPVKASGGSRDKETANNYIHKGVKRLGTSSAEKILTS